MLKKASFSLLIACLVISGGIISGCTTAHSRRQNDRIEELERRVSKIEFNSNEPVSTDEEDYSRYLQQARVAR